MAIDKEMKEALDEQIENLVYVGQAVIDKLIEEKIPEKAAKLIRAYYDAFVAEGFSSTAAVDLARTAAGNSNFNFNKQQ